MEIPKLYLSFFILIIFVTTDLSHAEIVVAIINDFGSTVQFHCRSKDIDLGNQRLQPGGSWSFHFQRNFFGRSLFFCSFDLPNGKPTGYTTINNNQKKYIYIYNSHSTTINNITVSYTTKMDIPKRYPSLFILIVFIATDLSHADTRNNIPVANGPSLLSTNDVFNPFGKITVEIINDIGETTEILLAMTGAKIACGR
ncbi:unnamed protein product [Brassica rapa subsp. trilocularis]